MIHTKFCGNRSASSGEDDFHGFLCPQLRRSLGGILVWACLSVRPSVCYTCTRSRTVRDRILKFGM